MQNSDFYSGCTVTLVTEGKTILNMLFLCKSVAWFPDYF